MTRAKCIVLICTWLLIASACTSTPVTESPQVTPETISPSAATPHLLDVDDNGCISPPFSFKYQVSGKQEIISFSTILPPEPWYIETILPEFSDDALAHRSKDWILAVFTRSDGEYEIWILRSWANEISGSDYEFMEILVYNTKTNEWRTISPEVSGTPAVVGELFMTEDGSIWAHNYWGEFFLVFEPPVWVGISNYDESDFPSDIPILSRYNEQEDRFEPVANADNIPASKLDGEEDKVLLDDNGDFWIIVQGDAIYSFIPETQAIQYHTDFQDVFGNPIVRSVSLAPTGDIFLSDDGHTILRFSPETNTVEIVGGTPLPFENQNTLYFHGILIDEINRLWVGDVGWAEPDEYHIWYQLVPSPVFIDFSEGQTTYAQHRPWLLMESTDGRLWYKSTNGLTSLDPQKEEWCWFTTEQSNIVEDEQNNLWIVADGKLYKYEITP